MSASAKLDEVRSGSQMVLALALARLSEATELLGEGKFTEAAQALNEAQNRVSALSNAEQLLATFDGLVLKQAKDLERGDLLYNAGPIEWIQQDIHHEGMPDEHRIVKAGFEGGAEVTYNMRDECLIVPTEEG